MSHINGTAASDIRKALGKRGLEVIDDHADLLEEIQRWARQVAIDMRVLQAEVKELQAFKDAVIASEAKVPVLYDLPVEKP